MVCSNCGKEIPNNSAYCIFCHAPTEYSEDISVNLDILEDDELIGTFNSSVKKPQPIEIKTDEKSPKTKKTVIISLVSFICCLGVIILSASYLNSYSYIIKKANKAMESGEYDNAYKLYEKALSKNNDSVEALLGAGEASKNAGNYEESEKLLIKALDLDGENNTAFASLLDLYDKTDHQDKIADAEKYVNTSAMKEIFSEIAIESPVISLEGGEYKEEIIITLTSKSNLQMYYTIDGRDPSKGEGALYEGEIILSEEGEYKLRACCYKDGRFGKVTESVYTLKFDTPPMPEVTPMTGSFTEETKVTIKSDVPGAKIYYTWDGTNPTESSKRYKDPLVIPEGNNVLSIIVVSKNGKISDVLRVNYTYLPGETETETLTEETITGDISEESVSGESSLGNQSNNKTQGANGNTLPVPIIDTEDFSSEDE